MTRFNPRLSNSGEPVEVIEVMKAPELLACRFVSPVDTVAENIYLRMLVTKAEFMRSALLSRYRGTQRDGEEWMAMTRCYISF